MKFSLVMCTIGRTVEPERLMCSLVSQTYKNFELIVVDQNQDGRLAPIVEKFASNFPIILLRSSPGLSRARNVGLSSVSGDIVAFPDDDCWYPTELLDGVRRCFEVNAGWAALSARRADDERSISMLEPGMLLSVRNLWGRVPSYSLFIKRSWVGRTGLFDESLGVGASTPWGAGEDTDYVLRAMACGATWGHEPRLRVFHPPAMRLCETGGLLRARSYSRGLGRVLRKNRLPLWMVLGGCVLSFGRACCAFALGRRAEARWHLEVLVGRVEGWFSGRGARQRSVDAQ